jgi:hypothetical protein
MAALHLSPRLVTTLKFVVKKCSDGEFRFELGAQQRSGRRYQQVIQAEGVGAQHDRVDPEERRRRAGRRSDGRLTPGSAAWAAVLTRRRDLAGIRGDGAR